ncbi:MAG: DUF2927 domain-containing protein [Pseudomonadota bacterium]
MRSIVVFVLAVLSALPCVAKSPFSDEQLIDGFNRTVFGSEYATILQRTGLVGGNYVRKFAEPVRFHIVNRHTDASGQKVRAFIGSLNGYIKGLNARLVTRPWQANFTVYIVRRRDYARTVRRDVFRRSNAPVRGRCMVRAVFSRAGIARADAVIVADEGKDLFSRCMVEEILQGLGPLNDDRTLEHSIFNDESRFTNFRRFDRLILNMLYDPALPPGLPQAEAAERLPALLKRVRRAVETP